MAERVVTRSQSTSDMAVNTTELLDKLEAMLDKKLDEKLSTLKQEICADTRVQVDFAVQSLEQKLEELTKENNTLREEIAKTNKRQDECNARFQQLDKQYVYLQRKSIANEQYSRRKSIRVFGLEGKDDENCSQLITTLVTDTLKKQLSPENIVTAHRITSSKSPRPIIAVFDTHDTKMDIIKRRKVLKASKVVITEDLCRDLSLTMNRFRNYNYVTDVWAWDSKIYAKNKDGEVAQVTWGQSYGDAFIK